VSDPCLEADEGQRLHRAVQLVGKEFTSRNEDRQILDPKNT